MATYSGGYGRGSTYEIAPPGLGSNVGAAVNTRTMSQIPRYNFPDPVLPKIELVTDDFTNTATPSWQAFPYGTVARTGGVFTATSTAIDQSHGVQSNDNWTLNESFVSVQVTSQTTNGNSAELIYGSAVSGGGGAAFSFVGSTLNAYVNTGGGNTLAGVVNSIVGGIYMRMRLTSGTLFMEYSQNGKVWTNIPLSVQPPPAVRSTLGHFNIQLSSYGGTGASTATFDNLNVLPVVELPRAMIYTRNSALMRSYSW